VVPALGLMLQAASPAAQSGVDPSVGPASASAADTTRPAGPTRAKKADRKTARSPLSISGAAGLQFIYDDNIVRYSDEYIDDFVHGRYPEKFAIETYDDLIISPMAEIALDARYVPRRPTSLRFRYTAWRYARNGTKNNDAMSVRLRQPAFGADYLELNYYYAPMAYIRELPDRAPFTPRSAPMTWSNFDYAYNSFSAAYWRRVGSRWEVRGRVGRVLRFYNRPFMENDTWEWNYSGSLRYAFSERLKVRVEYTYHDAKARGADIVGETLETSDDSDPSFERDTYEIVTDYYFRGSLWIVRSAQLGLEYFNYFFTSEKPLHLDPFHTGRKDTFYRVEIGVETAEVWRNMSLLAGYRFTERTTSSPWTGDIAEDKDYRNHRVWTGLTYSF
jgi:hypothetical protein